MAVFGPGTILANRKKEDHKKFVNLDEIDQKNCRPVLKRLPATLEQVKPSSKYVKIGYIGVSSKTRQIIQAFQSNGYSTTQLALGGGSRSSMVDVSNRLNVPVVSDPLEMFTRSYCELLILDIDKRKVQQLIDGHGYITSSPVPLIKGPITVLSLVADIPPKEIKKIFFRDGDSFARMMHVEVVHYSHGHNRLSFENAIRDAKLMHEIRRVFGA